MHKFFILLSALSLSAMNEQSTKKLRKEYESYRHVQSALQQQINQIPQIEEQRKIAALVICTFLSASAWEASQQIPKKLLENFSLSNLGTTGWLIVGATILYAYKIFSSALHADCLEREDKMRKKQEHERKKLFERLEEYHAAKDFKIEKDTTRITEWKGKFEQTTAEWRQKNDEIIQSLKKEFDKAIEDFKRYKAKIEEHLETKMTADLSALTRRLDEMQELIGKSTELRVDIYQSVMQRKEEIKRNLGDFAVGLTKFQQFIQPILTKIDEIVEFLKQQNYRLRDLESHQQRYSRGTV